VIDNQEKLIKTHFHQRLLINNRLKKLNTATLSTLIKFQSSLNCDTLNIRKSELVKGLFLFISNTYPLYNYISDSFVYTLPQIWIYQQLFCLEQFYDVSKIY
jgi:hypothetical protein